VTVNSGLICSGSSFSIIPAGASTYTIEGGNTSVSPLTNTSYTVNGTSAEGCVSANTAISSVTVNTTPTVSVNSGSICEGESFTITPSGALTYTISGGNTVVSPVTTSTYNVSGSSAEGCVSNNTAVSSVTVHAKPAVLVTSTSTMLCAGESVSLTASGALSYSWNTSENTAAITVTPATTAAYTVTGTDANGCSLTVSFSQEVNACTGLQNAVRASEIGMQVYPNPTNGAFTLELEGLSGEYTTLTLSNTLGQIVYRERTQLSQISLNISDLEAGLYILKAENKGLVKTVRIIKE
jgi:hypothetical protein